MAKSSQTRLCPNKWQNFNTSEILVVKQRPVDIYLCPLCGNEIKIQGRCYTHVK